MSAIDDVILEDSAVSASAVSISAWDPRKAQSFIGRGQERRYESMKQPIAEDESTEETEIADDQSGISMSAVSSRSVSSYRGNRGRGRGRVMKSDRDNLPGTGLARGGFRSAGIGRGQPAKPDDAVSVIGRDLSRVSLATKSEAKVENGRGRSEAEEEGQKFNDRGVHERPQKENNTFTYDFNKIANLEFSRTVVDSRIHNVDTCSMMGQLDSDDNEEGSKMFEDESEARPSPQPAITRAESVCSLRDNFQYEESIDEYSESVSKVDVSPPQVTEKPISLMPCRRRKTPPPSPPVPNMMPRRTNRVSVVRRKIENESREEKINFYKQKADSSRIKEDVEGEKEFPRPHHTESSAFRRSSYDSRDFSTPGLPPVQFKGGPMNLSEEEEAPKEEVKVKREVEIVQPAVSYLRGFPHQNEYQREGREPRLLSAYQHLLNEYEKIVSIVIHAERKREERSLMNKSSHIDKVQKSVEAFKWRLYEEQQNAYQAPTVDYGPVIDLKDFKYEQNSEKRERRFPTEKIVSVDVEKVIRESQVRFTLRFKDVGDIDIFFLRKSIDNGEVIFFQANPSHNFTGKTQFGMEIIPNKKYRDSKKKAKQFVFGNEMPNPMPMREIYIDTKFKKYFFDHNSTFTANIYVIGFEVFVSPCVRVVQLLQESQKQLRRGVKDYIDFINSPRDVHESLVALGDQSSDSEDYSSSS